ncbi:MULTISPECIES: 16S rRNA (cytidine(1402)-2'-O)-methyltransferase [unclassified Butyrivibrio]|uniref:16S rRNA (cytidine(1402)-2'-O)-methyltransferase n=1 Tax=unclassified Butyrivibrio TaxID=2639466 RepID=UPI0004162D54|nr:MULTISPECIES: 16S rRNA (cytidine(1402)-2'-O)-methyltransferase [unclassified Butyrivibrio]SEL58895.1 16S rRNA (cytidine1402-2'-O)-methyltransferase [Butyrivibrio sp. ob235]
MDSKTGMLYLCATPIGNLGDITERVLETLRSVDIIAAEDTRNSIKLLNHFDIHTEMTSYHEYNKVEKAEYLIRLMQEGKDIALITDAGTPAISDPGEVLVRMCHEAGITVTSLPGPAACITALTLSGLNTRRFVFEGFLPGLDDKKERRRILEQLRDEHRTIIMYEAPHHLRGTLNDLRDALGNRKLTVCRELTKRFEEIMPTTIEGAVTYYEENEPRGEYVLVIEGISLDELDRQQRQEWSKMSLQDHMAYYENGGMSHKDAMKQVAADRGVGKREIYKALLED